MVLKIMEVGGQIFKPFLVTAAADFETAKHRLELHTLDMIDFGKIVLNQVRTFLKLNPVKLRNDLGIIQV